LSFGDDVYKRGEAERFGYELPLTVDDLIFLQDIGVQMSRMDVKRACELDNYYWTPFQDGAGSCYVTRVAVLRREGAIRHWQKFAAKTWDEAQAAAVAWLRENMEVGDDFTIVEGWLWQQVEDG